jgi:hypothetical protein
MKRVPQEGSRPQVPYILLEAAIDGIRSHIHGACAELVVNFVEVGISEEEDQVERKVIIPCSVTGKTIFMVSTAD